MGLRRQYTPAGISIRSDKPRVAVIVTPGSATGALAAKSATATIPIVFWTATDPVQAGLVSSLNRPGGNLTGLSSMGVEIGEKHLGLLYELLPGAKRFAMLANPTASTAESMIKEVQSAASALDRQIEVFPATTNRDIGIAFAILVQKRFEALLVNGGNLFARRRVQLTSLAMRHGIPAIYFERQFAEAGGLMSYGTSTRDLNRQVGIYAGRILNGENAADLPVMRAVKFEFVINVQTATILVRQQKNWCGPA